MIRLPNITAATDTGQLAQIKSYLYQLTSDLEYALSALETKTDEQQEQISEGKKTETPKEKFSSIKSLIIKSADIVNAYYEEIDKKLTGEYVAQSDFGTFKESTSASITANSTQITQAYTNIQTVSDAVSVLQNTILNTSAYIKTGLLGEESGTSIYGLEIGQTSTKDGEKVFYKFARFTSDRLSFYSGETEVAYISQNRLYIASAEVTGTFILGKYRMITDNGIAWKWIGG